MARAMLNEPSPVDINQYANPEFQMLWGFNTKIRKIY